MKKIMFGLLLVVGCLLLVNSAWSFPMYINVQGKLTPVPPNGTYMWFKLYRGGSETTRGTQIVGLLDQIGSGITMNENGVFNYKLPIGGGDEFVSTEAYYLGVQVYGSGDTEMRPLKRLVSVPFTIMTKNLMGGSVEAVGNPAVKGTYSSNTYALLGRSDSTLKKHYGVYGAAREGIGTSYGVFGEGKDYGIYGTSEAGIPIYGIGITSGGSFESNNANGAVGITRGSRGLNTVGVVGRNFASTSGGPGVYGENKSGYGVYGKGRTNRADSSTAGIGGPAAKGYNSRSSGGYGVYGSGEAISVYGETDGAAGIGVKGAFYLTGSNYNGAGGSFESSGNFGVRGSSSLAGPSVCGILGEAPGSSTGIRGDNSTTGQGVWGDSSANGTGVYGSSETGTGVMGRAYEPGHNGVIGFSMSANGVGVFGDGVIGVRGNGTYGGSFESSAGPGVYAKQSYSQGNAIKAETTRSTNAYSVIYGKSAGRGAGIYASNISTISYPAGLYASSESGPALEIGSSGWIKMPIGKVGWYPTGSGTDTDPSTTEVWINSTVGVIDYEGRWGLQPPDGFWMKVHNDHVKNAIIIISCISDVNNSMVTEVNNSDHTFKVWCEDGNDIAFLILNKNYY